MDFDPSCLLSMSKDGWRKISAMHVTLKVGIKYDTDDDEDNDEDDDDYTSCVITIILLM